MGTLCDLASDALRQVAEGLIYTLGRWLNTGGKLSLLCDIMKNTFKNKVFVAIPINREENSLWTRKTEAFWKDGWRRAALTVRPNGVLLLKGWADVSAQRSLLQEGLSVRTIPTQDICWRILLHKCACSRSVWPSLISAAAALCSFMYVWMFWDGPTLSALYLRVFSKTNGTPLAQ